MFISVFIYFQPFFSGKRFKVGEWGVTPYKVPGGQKTLPQALLQCKDPGLENRQETKYIVHTPLNKPLLFPIKMISSKWKCIFVWNPRSQSLQLAPTDMAAHGQCVRSK